ncbi:hypothetical protein [Echinicola salinicaeni]|uniref:hypothetical protein n=1 Tax=Echinicola salinicaeni TaxID=2762757 RepID=UPI001646B240|nr:hypothetical protein [Echinicola salinicaeni]
MTKRTLLFISFTTLVFTACGVSYSEKNSVKIKEKNIDGVEYRFANQSKYKSVKFSFARGFMLENKISFIGLEDDIHKVIGKSDFERKINLKNTESLHIDSISFDVNKSKNKIDLLYYLNLDNQAEMVTMSLEKNKDQWTLN